ncbi:Transposase for insertion sequence element IS231B [Bacillus thuringiensis MC28]|nr:Transposase for insertion sequence element IS231B [Bacillus thuringiensis MC28]EEL33796.1 hypothetical protein bcere0019_28740 [Bacillus cereus Rock3-28]
MKLKARYYSLMLMRKGDVLFMNMHQKQELYRFFSFGGICFS